jgi:putative transposase
MTSSGECLELPSASILKLEKKIARAQRRLAKKKKFSNNWKKQKLKVAHFHIKIGNIRKDALHKISNNIAKNHGLVVLEVLKIKNMTKSSKGTAAEPGKRINQKSGLNRSILRQGWGELERQLSYKTIWNGGHLLKVPAPFTSQRCAACGHVDKLNRINEAFKCLLCGNLDHADVNAAKNILALGHSAAVCGGASAGGLVQKTKPRRAPMKQKPISA